MKSEREKFEESLARKIENFCDAVFDGRYYVMRENSRLNQRDKEFLILSLNRSWSAWQAAKVEAVPDGYMVINEGVYNLLLQTLEKLQEKEFEAQEKESGC